MAKKRAKSRATKTSTLAPEWRSWIAENLARGAARTEIEATLGANGVPPDEMRRRIDEIAVSPGLIEARRIALEHEKLKQVVQLVREQHRMAGTEVERREGVDAHTFYRRWYATNTPVILTDYTAAWPALHQWTPEFFRDELGQVEVEVAVGREADPDYDRNTGALSVNMPMRELAERILASEGSNDFYMVARNRNLEDAGLARLFDDLPLDGEILDPEKRLGACQLWFGPSGTVTPLHHDTSNILFCQVYGTKRIRLASPLETELGVGASAMYAAFDPEADESDVPMFDVTLEAGEALFIPVGWWHHVRSLSASISVALNCFSRDNNRRWYCPGKLV